MTNTTLIKQTSQKLMKIPFKQSPDQLIIIIILNLILVMCQLLVNTLLQT